VSGAADAVLTGSLLVAVPLAVLAGLVSFASPCVLPLVPAYLSYVTGLPPAPAGPVPAGQPTTGPASDGRVGVGVTTATASRRRTVGATVLGTLLFVAGFTAVFVSYGALFGGLGSVLLEYQQPVTRVLGLLTIVVGLAFGGWLPGLDRERRFLDRVPGAGLAAAPVLGVLFAIGWTPCIGPTLAAVQVLAFDQGTAARGALLSLAYCVGLGLPFVLFALAYERAVRVSGWLRRHSRAVQRVGAAVLVLLGLALVTGLWSQAMAGLQGWVSGFQVVL
jgi:cytochrome c-type biogenesis protein